MLGILAPRLVPYIFGDNWLRTGEIISWLVPPMLLQFVVSPVSMSLHATNNQIYALYLQFFGLVIRTGAVALAVKFAPEFAIEAFALSNAFFYTIYAFLVYKMAHPLRCQIE
jgi:O-antigen/teichoic acid export membrane protein